MADMELVVTSAKPRIALYQEPHFIVQFETESGTLFLKIEKWALDHLCDEIKNLS